MSELDSFADAVALEILLDMAAEEPPCVREYAVSVFDDVTAPNVVRLAPVAPVVDLDEWRAARDTRGAA
jgi:hypothetical protein